jgi:serpin B
MTRIPRPLLSLTLTVSAFLLCPAIARPAPTQAPAEGNTAFALDLFGQLKSRPGNLFFSPYSISTALAMTYAGARGNTEKQMAQVLHFNQEQPRLHSSFGELQHQLGEAANQKGVELNIANALWAEQGHPFLPAFLEIAKTRYQAAVKQTDFKTAAEPARLEINQ